MAKPGKLVYWDWKGAHAERKSRGRDGGWRWMGRRLARDADVCASAGLPGPRSPDCVTLMQTARRLLPLPLQSCSFSATLLKKVIESGQNQVSGAAYKSFAMSTSLTVLRPARRTSSRCPSPPVPLSCVSPPPFVLQLPTAAQHRITMSALQALVMATLASLALAQVSTVPAYITSSKYTYPTTLSSAALQAVLARQLYASAASPRRALLPAPSSPSSRYGLSAASNPSIVAIPLYVRNQAAGQKNSPFYEILSAAPEKKAASNKYAVYQSKKAYGEAAAYREPSARPVYYAKYEQPKASPSNYEPVRSYELKNSEPGYGDASSVALLSSGYGQQQGSVSIAYPPASYKQSASQSTSRPQLKAVEYDDSQKSALSDFAAALENFDLKSITSQDIYDLPPVNPPLTRLVAPKKQDQRASSDDYASPSQYSKAQSSQYESPKASYASPSYDDSRPTYATQPPSMSLSQASQSYTAPETYSSYASPASNTESYRQSPDAYRSDTGRASSYAERPAAESYRSSAQESYGTQATYVAAPSGYESSSFAAAQDVYASRPTSSGDYYAPAATSVRPNPDDPNCPYKEQASSGGQAAEYASEPSNYSGKLSPVPPAKEEAVATGGQGYETDELDPSKLDLKIVHLPVSVLKRLVGNGELALPSFNKKK